jgi:hypothetical protein
MAASVFFVRPADGRFMVCSTLPGTSIIVAVVEDCPTLASAERECAWQQAEFERVNAADALDARLRGRFRSPNPAVIGGAACMSSTRHPAPLIIGLTGHAGTGKDTAADHLCNVHGFERYGFADPLRNMVESFLNDAGIDYAYLFERGLKEEPVPQLGISTRQMMQRLGTEWGRGLRDDLWLRMADLALGLPHAPVHSRIVITDVRFPNEAAWLAGYGGRLVRIVRDVPGVNAHESERYVSTLQPWLRIDNTTSVARMHERLDDMMSVAAWSAAS